VRAILEGALDAVIAIDATGHITFWNARAQSIFGWTASEAQGREFISLIVPARERPAYRRGLQRALRTGKGGILDQRMEVTGLRRSGEEFPLEIAITHVREGEFHTFSAFLRDITGRRQAERERERLLEEAERARMEAEAASRAKDQFLSTLSHELRTPLTSIVGWVYLLRSRPADPAVLDRGLEVIDRNTMIQARLVSEILDMSRILTARLRLNVRPVALAPLVAGVLETLMPAARAKQLRVQPVLDPTAGPCLGDPDRLQQVTWNLLSNAIKFTPAGGRVQVRLTGSDGHVELSVRDNGIGIAPSLLPHVFDLFRQGDSSNTRSHGGLGLGLAIVRQLVELHGGRVDAESDGPGSGATFTVRLPRALADAEALPGRGEPIPEPAPEILPGEPSLLEGLSVLLVDAGDDSREVLGTILKRHGARVDTAGTAAEALDAVTRRHPDVLVAELELPDESGFALLARVRALPPESGGRTPAAVLTGHGRSDDRVQSLLAGFQLHLAKPVQPAELVAAVASLAGRPRL
jgi:PAS domain S-box-containing protein